jgi:L-asparaginase/Glu-tRNA(Gln) amidotransferase subunit D
MPLKIAKQISKINKKDKPILLTSQCKYGKIELGNYSSSKILSQNKYIKTLSNVTIEYAVAYGYLKA